MFTIRLLSVLFIVAQCHAVLSHLHLCFLLDDHIQDQGYAYQANVGRLKIHKALTTAYPGVPITSTVYDGFGYIEDKDAVIRDFVSKCNVIVTTNRGVHVDRQYFWRVARANPTIFLIDVVLCSASWTSPLTNYVQAVFSGRQTNTMMGIIAGGVAKRCVGLIHRTPPWHPPYGISQINIGMARTNSTVPLVALALLDQDFDFVATRILIGLGCDAIVHMTTGAAPNAVVEDYKHGVMSIGFGTDALEHFGDSVITSIIFNFDSLLLPIITNYYNNDQVPSQAVTGTFATGAMSIGLYNPNVSAALPSLVQSNVDTIASWMPPPPFATSWANIENFTLLTPRTCPAGTYFSYDRGEGYALQCLPCPQGTYSTTNGTAACTQCPDLTVPTAERTACVVPPPSSSLRGSAIGGIALGSAGFLGLLVIVALVIHSRLHNGPSPLEAAPEGPIVALGLLRLEPSDRTQSRKWRRSLLTISERLFDIVTKQCRENHGYISATAGEVHLIACRDPKQLYRIVWGVDNDIRASDWPVDVVLNAVMVHGECLVRTLPPSPVGPTRRQYSGALVDTLTKLLKALPQGMWADIRMLSSFNADSIFAVNDTRTVTLRGGNSVVCGLTSRDVAARAVNPLLAKSTSEPVIESITEEEEYAADFALSVHSGSSLSSRELGITRRILADGINALLRLLEPRMQLQMLDAATRRLKLVVQLPTSNTTAKRAQDLRMHCVTRISQFIVQHMEQLELLGMMTELQEASEHREGMLNSSEDDRASSLMPMSGRKNST